jgi:hypothetical protein
MELTDRLQAGRIATSDGGGCWRWSGEHTQGYGTIVVLGRKQRVHRVAYEILIGEIGPDEDVRQTCTKYRDCFNPAHLVKVDGSAPKATSTRRTPKNAKLDPDKVREIRRRLKKGDKHTDIARDYGISDVLVHYVEQRKVWAKVPDDPEPPVRRVVKRPASV